MEESAIFYKLILVDDEDEVRGRISSRISEDSGFRVVGTAGNGHDALELIDEHSPHVVITDIRMPFIDGMELARIIKREYPTIRVAFITGYDEFDYAREAVELGVKSYLTKPLTQGDIARFLGKLKSELDEEFRRNSDMEMMRSRYRESLPLIIDDYFSSFLSRPLESGEEAVQDLKELGILMDRSAVLILVDVERDESHPDIFRREQRKSAVRESLKDIFHRRGMDCHHFRFQDSIVFVLFRPFGLKGSGMSRAEERSALDEALLESVQTVRMYHSIRIDIGVSSGFRGFEELRGAYMEARRALTDSQFLNRGRIVYIGEVEQESPKSIVMSEEEARSVEYAVKFGSDEDLARVVAEERKKIGTFGDAPADYRLYMLNLLNIAINFASSVGGDITRTNGGDVLDTVAHFGGLEQMFDWFEYIIRKLREENSSTKMDNSRTLLENAVAYIKAHYADASLSLEKTCAHAGISVSYLSLLFRKNTGKTFVKFLTEIRMEKARERLKYSDDRIIEIAEDCGYRDVYYFSHSFKKYQGMSPRQYRAEQNKD